MTHLKLPRFCSCLVILGTLIAFSTCWGKHPETGSAENVRRLIRADAKEMTLEVGGASFVLVRIPAGEFDLGSPRPDVMAQRHEMPAQHIRLTKPFYLGATEVSQLQYREVMGEHLNSFRGDELPVEGLRFAEALEFCDTLTRESGIEVTLPTEAQWEYACRAGTTTRYYSGEEVADLAAVSWFKDNSEDTTHKCGLKAPNRWGLHDMLGNVWEPCLDRLPSYDTVAQTDPVGEMRPVTGMMRGGCWSDTAENCRAATRMLAHDLAGGMGVRIVINVEDYETR